MPGENTDDIALSTWQEMRRCLIEYLDKLSSEISSRFSNITKAEKLFGRTIIIGTFLIRNNFNKRCTVPAVTGDAQMT